MNKWFFGAGGAYAPSAFCPRKVNTFCQKSKFSRSDIRSEPIADLSYMQIPCRNRGLARDGRQRAFGRKEGSASDRRARTGRCRSEAAAPNRTARRTASDSMPAKRRHRRALHERRILPALRTLRPLSGSFSSSGGTRRARSASYRTTRSAAVRSGPTAAGGPQDAGLSGGIPQPEPRTLGRQPRRTDPEQEPSGTEHRRKRKQARRIAPTACFPSNRRYRRNRISNV